MNDPVCNFLPLEGICASLCEMMGVAPPKGAGAPLTAFSDLLRRAGKVDRIFMYNPDAVVMWLYQKYDAWYTPVLRHTSLALRFEV